MLLWYSASVDKISLLLKINWTFNTEWNYSGQIYEIGQTQTTISLKNSRSNEQKTDPS